MYTYVYVYISMYLYIYIYTDSPGLTALAALASMRISAAAILLSLDKASR